jgi:hypothetical protein
MHQMRRAGTGPRFLRSFFPKKPDERAHVARDRDRGQAVVNDQMRVLNWTQLPPLAACT